MTILVYLQLLWIVMGVVFNLISLYRIRNGKLGLMATPPMFGIVMLCGFAPIVLLGLTNWLIGYAFFNVLMVGFIFWLGVLRHLLSLKDKNLLERYASVPVLITGAAINLFGVVVGFSSSVLAVVQSWGQVHS